MTFAFCRRHLGIEEVFFHHDYNNTVDSDIALLKLAHPLNLSTYTPICLPERNSMFVGSTAWVYGWGLMGTEGWDNHTAIALQETTVQVISNQQCNKTEHWPGPEDTGVLPSQLCAWTEGQDSCRGDSGGPLSLEGQDGRHLLIGVVSFGEQFCGGVAIICRIIIDCDVSGQGWGLQQCVQFQRLDRYHHQEQWRGSIL